MLIYTVLVMFHRLYQHFFKLLLRSANIWDDNLFYLTWTVSLFGYAPFFLSPSWPLPFVPLHFSHWLFRCAFHCWIGLFSCFLFSSLTQFITPFSNFLNFSCLSGVFYRITGTNILRPALLRFAYPNFSSLLSQCVPGLTKRKHHSSLILDHILATLNIHKLLLYFLSRILTSAALFFFFYFLLLKENVTE